MRDTHPMEDLQRVSRRHFFGISAAGLGSVALSSLLGQSIAGSAQAAATPSGLQSRLQFPPRIKRVIYLFQAGGPAQQDLFEMHDKPERPSRICRVLDALGSSGRRP